ncbi:YodC family protein [Mucilaginibacter dorajii]|uniref:DUF2158 domain-containing protein n=1 Tax=Mucilaginibacter dorajii TaxID=692994 RepID=A0ABP7QU51_9SPHI|nr:DUF2158 domain-containing protein [Mucilaginibacter dorajii]MCS3735800.1 uncharacterized protein YodC (DUF2158 family) [Mucilaginibacter dorajii]
MSESIFKEGDVVRLQSGGPKMTIDGFAWDKLRDKPYNDRVECTWFDEKNAIQKGTFKTILLELD